MKNIAQASKVHYARFWAELPFLLKQSSTSRLMALFDEASCESILASATHPGGCIFTSAYFGNPVVAALSILRIRGSLAVIADFDQFPVASIWRRYWQNIDGLTILNRTEAVRRIPDLLKIGGAIFTIAEHHRPTGAGVVASWLGRSINAYRTVGVLAESCGATILPICCQRADRPMSFEFSAGSPIQPRVSPDHTVETMLATLEARILRRPAQYLWSSLPQD